MDIYIIGGYAEPTEASTHACYTSLSLFAPSGEEVGRYGPTTPELDPWIYRDGDLWGITWTRGVDLPVFETSIGTIGMAVCSEIYASEIARGLALQGAELLFFPAGIMGPSYPLFHTWRTMIWARAIENLACTAMCTNVTSLGGEGLAMVCSPESVVLERHDPGLRIGDVDLDRVHWLREEQDGLFADGPPYQTKPGILRDWRRREVLQANRSAFGPEI